MPKIIVNTDEDGVVEVEVDQNTLDAIVHDGWDGKTEFYDSSYDDFAEWLDFVCIQAGFHGIAQPKFA